MSKLGKHILRRKRGVPMGSSISPAKASIALSDMEVKAYRDEKKAKKRKFIAGKKGLRALVSGVRSADDITFFSKRFCRKCVRKWARCV